MLGRRELLGGLALAEVALAGPVLGQGAAPAEGGAFGAPEAAFSSGGRFGETFMAALREAERAGGGRLGVAALDTATRAWATWRGAERFPLASTFKLVLAGAVLREVDEGREDLERRVPITASDLVDYAPVTEKRVGPEGMRVGELLEAIMVWSDNAAANLLLPLVGGPEGLTERAGDWGDAGFRLDRRETALGEGRPGDPRDTTTPNFMLVSMERLLVGNLLSAPLRGLLNAWMIGCRTGDTKIRTGLPQGWICGNRSGTAGFGTSNDVAAIWPPGGRPILVAAYLTESAAPLEVRDAALAAVGRAVTAT
ncbi:class A beta-lactamase [Roseomonas sp. KE2513]|uniref:class A beta-lactamase n=1 Tax=Roseomonas sp. KE2513 TaxID=2479202 RepID=UPI0018E05082|nr:class A beta-lactamase [Roseomonas sp. KE2513]